MILSKSSANRVTEPSRGQGAQEAQPAVLDNIIMYKQCIRTRSPISLQYGSIRYWVESSMCHWRSLLCKASSAAIAISPREERSGGGNRLRY